MGKNKNNYQALCVEDVARKNPILTEQEINDFCSFEEIVADAKKMFDEQIQQILSQDDSNKGLQEKSIIFN